MTAWIVTLIKSCTAVVGVDLIGCTVEVGSAEWIFIWHRNNLIFSYLTVFVGVVKCRRRGRRRRGRRRRCRCCRRRRCRRRRCRRCCCCRRRRCCCRCGHIVRLNERNIGSFWRQRFFLVGNGPILMDFQSRGSSQVVLERDKELI